MPSYLAQLVNGLGKDLSSESALSALGNKNVEESNKMEDMEEFQARKPDMFVGF